MLMKLTMAILSWLPYLHAVSSAGEQTTLGQIRITVIVPQAAGVDKLGLLVELRQLPVGIVQPQAVPGPANQFVKYAEKAIVHQSPLKVVVPGQASEQTIVSTPGLRYCFRLARP